MCARVALASVVVALLTVQSVHAQSDLDLLVASAPPNVMILFDNSGSMNHHLWDDDFDPRIRYPAFCAWPQVPTIAGSDCSENPSGECPNNEYLYFEGGGIAAPHFLWGGSPSYNISRCGVSRTVYHDNTTWPWTRYSLNYLNWLYGVSTSTDRADEPTTTRLQTAKDTMSNVVQSVIDSGAGGVEPVRFGLMRFDNASQPQGAEVVTEITTPSGAAVISGIDAMVGDSWTPLSESHVDLGRYFAGSNQIGTFATSPLASPMDVECRNNFSVIVTDGEPTRDLNDHWTTAFMNEIGNYDADANECSLDAPATCTDAPSTGRDDSLIYLSDGTDWLDDVSAYLFQNDLEPVLDDTQNIVTYTIGFMVDHPLLNETAQNGGGSYYVTDSTDIGSLEENLLAALQDILKRSTSFTAATVPSSRSFLGDGLYSAYFVPSDVNPFWDGHLESYGLAKDGTVLDALGNDAIDPATGEFYEPRNPIWDAGEELKTNTSRTLYTTETGARITFDTTNVTRFELGLTPAELSSYSGYDDSGIVDPSDPNEVADAIAEALVSYVHGEDGFDDDLDNDYSELRTSVLGDIFHSRPILVGPPLPSLFSEEGFGVPSPAAPADPTFLDQYEQRDRVVYAGANDGLLHAFDAGQYDGSDPNHLYTDGTGAELFGYVPGLLVPQLKYLPRNSPRQHYYVDGSAAAADVWLGDGSGADTTKEPSEWATVLITGFRQGGDGYIALDVTDPDEISTAHSPYPKLLWEFTDPKLGESWSEPIITRVKLAGALSSGDNCGADNGDGDCREQWVAIFGGGYADDGDPNLATYIADPLDPSWSDRSKSIFMVRMDTGEVLSRVEFDATGVTGPSEMKYSIPSAPAVLDLDFDGFADVVYIGDLGGQLWKWDLTNLGVDSDFDDEIDNWPSGVFFRSDPVAMGGGAMHYRSIFAPPSAAYSNGMLNLALGSGERSNLNYPGDASYDDENRFFVVKDPYPTGALAFSVLVTEADLTDISGLDTDFNPTDFGFFFKAEESEKFMTTHTIFAGFVITASYIPDLSGGNICDQSGESRIYVFDLTSGLGFFTDATTTGDDARRSSLGPGAPTDPKITISTNGDYIYVQTSAARLVRIDAPPRSDPLVSTVYWRQIF